LLEKYFGIVAKVGQVHQF